MPEPRISPNAARPVSAIAELATSRAVVDREAADQRLVVAEDPAVAAVVIAPVVAEDLAVAEVLAWAAVAAAAAAVAVAAVVVVPTSSSSKTSSR